jgi:hypothetical protein
MILPADERAELAKDDPRLLELTERFERGIDLAGAEWADYLLDWIAYLRDENPDDPSLVDKVLALRETAARKTPPSAVA